MESYFRSGKKLPPGSLNAVMRVLQELQISRYTLKSHIDPFHKINTRPQIRELESERRLQRVICNVAGCAYECCNVQKGEANTIFTTADEYQKEITSYDEERRNHLEIVQDSGDGNCVACLQECGGCGTTEHGLIKTKPKDCGYYPLFPETVIDTEDHAELARVRLHVRDPKKIKCPMPADMILRHMAVVVDEFDKDLVEHPVRARQYLNSSISMSGYKPFRSVEELQQLRPEDLKAVFHAGNTLAVNHYAKTLHAEHEQREDIDSSLHTLHERLEQDANVALESVERMDGIRYADLRYPINMN